MHVVAFTSLSSILWAQYAPLPRAKSTTDRPTIMTAGKQLYKYTIIILTYDSFPAILTDEHHTKPTRKNSDKNTSSTQAALSHKSATLPVSKTDGNYELMKKLEKRRNWEQPSAQSQ